MKAEINQIHQLIERYLNNTITEEDKSELMKLIQSGQSSEFLKDRIGETMIEELKRGLMPDVNERRKSEKIFYSILEHRRTVRKRKFINVFRYAASLAILCVVGLLLLYSANRSDPPQSTNVTLVPNAYVTIQNEGSNTKKIDLPDGSTILLEPGSKVRYNQKFKNDREIFLSGEAFFNVTKDAAHPFLVYANEVTTKVLGTSFRIKANNGEREIVVAVKTGKVSVFAKSSNDEFQNADTEEITLTPNQQAIYKRTEHVVLKKVVEKPEVIVEQKALKSAYVNEQVIAILEALSKSYGVDIRYDEEALSDCTLTSDIIESEGLYDQLDIVCSALGGTYTLENDASIIIKVNGCI